MNIALFPAATISPWNPGGVSSITATLALSGVRNGPPCYYRDDQPFYLVTVARLGTMTSCTLSFSTTSGTLRTFLAGSGNQAGGLWDLTFLRGSQIGARSTLINLDLTSGSAGTIFVSAFLYSPDVI